MSTTPVPRRARRRPAGYTLIELLIVVALLGAASALLIPHLVGGDDMKLQAAVRLIIADLSFAQSDSLAHQELRRVHFYEDGSGYCIVRVTEADFDDPFDPEEADYIEDPLSSKGEGGRYIVDFTTDPRFEGITISGKTFDDNNTFVTYDPLGGTVQGVNQPGSGGEIELTFNDVVYTIEIAPFTGKLTVVRE